MLFGNLRDNQDFVIIKQCCNTTIKNYYGKTYKRLAESGAHNNTLELETMQIHCLCHETVVRLTTPPPPRRKP